MSSRVNLLLLLSALLSAITGVGIGARAQDRVPTVAEGALNAARTAAAPRHVTARPPVALPALTAAAMIAMDQPFLLASREPAYATRRRE